MARSAACWSLRVQLVVLWNEKLRWRLVVSWCMRPARALRFTRLMCRVCAGNMLLLVLQGSPAKSCAAQWAVIDHWGV
jgi:hypothetical protein